MKAGWYEEITKDSHFEKEKTNTMKADLHAHSKYSKRPAEWILRKLDCPESFTEPGDLYRIAKERGMSLVTITDHNAIDGCLAIADLPDTFISEEVTTYFPEDRCKLHVLVYDIDEGQHREIQRLRENVFDLVSYLNEQAITHALAHPLYSINGKLTVDHFEKTLLLFKNFELNGARNEEQNQILERILGLLDRSIINRLTDKHGLVPVNPQPWKKNVLGGSDDHSSLTLARRYTEVRGARNLGELIRGIEDGRAQVFGPASSPKTLAHSIYSIAYQFYRHKFKLDRYSTSDATIRFLDGFLLQNPQRHRPFLSKINSLWSHRKYRRQPEHGNGKGTLLQILTREADKLLSDDPQLCNASGNGNAEHIDQKWFECVNRISNTVLCGFADHVFDSLSGANFLNVFHSLGSAGALYCLLAPYFVAFSIYSEDRRFSAEVLTRFQNLARRPENDARPIMVAHFTDTLYEINGVASTLRQQIRVARTAGKSYTVITCDAEKPTVGEGIHNFKPIRVYELSVYPEQKLFYPPFMEMLDYCYRKGFTHIHSATPGPVGLAALGIARILRLPIVGTYHTALPQYAHHLTQDGTISDLMWKYVIWYYDQMNLVYVPSRSTETELVEKGISAQKVRVFPRGVDADLFHPSQRNSNADSCSRDTRWLTLLYVGRVSREKNLKMLVSAFTSLSTERDDVRLVVVGDGPYREEMQEALRGYPCLFTGYLEGKALASAYASSDLFVFPSTTDTFGNVVLEAQASGIPVIVTDAGGPQENIIPGTTGIVVRGDDEASLLRGLKTMLDVPDRLKRMGQEARKYAETRSFDRAFHEAWRLYSEIENKKNGDSEYLPPHDTYSPTAAAFR